MEDQQNGQLLPCEERLRELGLFSPEYGSIRRTVRVSFQCLGKSYQEDRDRLFKVVHAMAKRQWIYGKTRQVQTGYKVSLHFTVRTVMQ